MGQVLSSSADLAVSQAQGDKHPRRHDFQETITSSREEPRASVRDRMIQKRRRSHIPKVCTISLDNRAEQIVDRICNIVVGEVIQVFWPEINCWVDGEILAYTNRMSKTATAGMHYIQYEDGIKEWKKLKKFRVVMQYADGSMRALSSSSERVATKKRN